MANSKIVRLYKWSRVDEVLDTQYGTITVNDWLKRERDRILSDSSRKAMIVRNGFYATLFINKPDDLLRRVV
ncbi:MAG: hypothetical protein Q8Q90_01345 [bacterium]|nr:hypothetical protein [bacterium]